MALELRGCAKPLPDLENVDRYLLSENNHLFCCIVGCGKNWKLSDRKSAFKNARKHVRRVHAINLFQPPATLGEKDTENVPMDEGKTN